VSELVTTPICPECSDIFEEHGASMPEEYVEVLKVSGAKPTNSHGHL
jgi:hypothetical protein